MIARPAACRMYLPQDTHLKGHMCVVFAHPLFKFPFDATCDSEALFAEGEESQILNSAGTDRLSRTALGP